MKVILKFDNRTVIVENVSVDEKCFPLVGGVHPYPEASLQSSHLANQSSLWFKTLAVDCVFVDCDSNEIHWFPVVSQALPDLDVILRRPKGDHYEVKEALSSGKPLFEDAALYEMDASLKGMMLTCTEAMRKLAENRISRADFNRAIATILHVYILPSISFTADDSFCLSRTRCLIEERLNNAENMIKCVVESIDRLETCLETLRTNLLYREDFESEQYLLSCSKEFLVAFGKNLEELLVKLNLSLEAEQSKVNWAKQRNDDPDHIAYLKQSRDKVHAEVIQLIQVREAIRNVAVRKETSSVKRSRRRRKTSAVVASCFHDVFVEVMRRLEAENVTLGKLCQDKVNISAAREAAMVTIMEIHDSTNRVTTFEPEEHLDYIYNVDAAQAKLDLWPTFQGRVRVMLEDTGSRSNKTHQQGCSALGSRIDLALSEFNLAVGGGESEVHSKMEDDYTVIDACDGGGVVMRNSSMSRDSKDRRSAVCTWKDGINIQEPSPKLKDIARTVNNNKIDSVAGLPQLGSGSANDFITRGVSSPDSISTQVSSLSKVLTPEQGSSACCDNNISQGIGEESVPQLAVNEMQQVNRHNGEHESKEADLKTSSEKYHNRIREKLALSALQTAVDEIKASLHTHFWDVVSCLSVELDQSDRTEDFSLTLADQKVLLWKAYERIFFKTKLSGQLTSLYKTLLTPGAQTAHSKLTSTSLQTILENDKILDLFYGNPDNDNALIETGAGIGNYSNILLSTTTPIDCVPRTTHTANFDKYSMARTLSELSLDVRHCAIEDLYTLANSDGSDMQRRFRLDSSGEDSDLPGSASDSPASSLPKSSVESILVNNRRSAEIPCVSHAAGSGSDGLLTTNLPAAGASAFSPADSGLTESVESMTTQISGGGGRFLKVSSGVRVDLAEGSSLEDGIDTAGQSVSSTSSFLSSTNLKDIHQQQQNDTADQTLTSIIPPHATISRQTSKVVQSRLDAVLSPFHKAVCKCVKATSVLDKLRYVTRALQELDRQVWQLLAPSGGDRASCDDILNMLVVALYNTRQDLFVDLYVSVRLLMDIWPPFLEGTLWNCSLVNMYGAYDFLFTRSVCERTMQDYSNSLRIRF